MITAGALSVTLALSTAASWAYGNFELGVDSDTSCIVMDMPVGGRLSPLDSLTLDVGGLTVKVCYGRPSARGRTMIGGRDVPYGRIWRTGANEPTMVHTTGPISIAGIELERGSYSLYTIPGEDQWTVILNSSITQWGHIARYDSKVRKQEVGRSTIARGRPTSHVETLTFRGQPNADGVVDLILEWEHSSIAIPVRAQER